MSTVVSITSEGRRIYRKNASDDQRPIRLMSSSETPDEAAVVAAPMRKLCDEIQEVIPHQRKARVRYRSNRARENGEPMTSTNKGPGTSGLSDKNNCR